ncbi:DUF6370 family protein [Ferruginibacter sp.]|nr:hypothetical protein [Ferruginibacter sp.]
MKPTLTLLLIFFMLTVSAQNNTLKNAGPDKTKKIQLVDAACGQCKFKLPGKTCDLAVRINDKAYFVDSAHIDAYGDAHAKDGFCNAIRKAEVQGSIINGRFVATYFRLVPPKNKVHTDK